MPSVDPIGARTFKTSCRFSLVYLGRTEFPTVNAHVAYAEFQRIDRTPPNRFDLTVGRFLSLLPLASRSVHAQSIPPEQLCLHDVIAGPQHFRALDDNALKKLFPQKRIDAVVNDYPTYLKTFRGKLDRVGVVDLISYVAVDSVYLTTHPGCVSIEGIPDDLIQRIADPKC